MGSRGQKWSQNEAKMGSRRRKNQRKRQGVKKEGWTSQRRPSWAEKVANMIPTWVPKWSQDDQIQKSIIFLMPLGIGFWVDFGVSGKRLCAISGVDLSGGGRQVGSGKRLCAISGVDLSVGWRQVGRGMRSAVFQKRTRSGEEADKKRWGTREKCPKTDPKYSNDAPRPPKTRQRRAQDVSKARQDAPITRQDGPRYAQDAPKPRQFCPRYAQDAILVVWGSQDGIKSAHNFHVGAILCQNSLITEKSYFSNRI